MARINIEDPFWIELLPLAAKLGDQDRAIGNAIRFFKFAQEKHKHGKFISETEFAGQGFSEALFGVFAERTEEGIQAVGAEKHFGWLKERVGAAKKGGEKSAQRPRDEQGHFLPAKQVQANPKQEPTKTKEHQASSSFSSSSSEILNTNTLKSRSNERARPGEVSELIAVYVRAFQNRYPKVRPDVSGKVQGQLRALLKSMTYERASQLLQVYLQIDDPWFKTKHYDISTFMENVNKVSVALDTGRDPNAPKSFKEIYEEHKARERESGL